MNTIINITLSILLLSIITSCNEKPKEGIMTDLKSEEFYIEYTKKALKDNGLDVYKYNFDNFTLGINHEATIKNIDFTVQQSKGIEKEIAESKIAGINLLVETIKEHNLEKKESFYERLLASTSDRDRLSIYEQEFIKTREELEQVNKTKDAKALKDIYFKNSYLNIITYDKSGNEVLNALPLINGRSEGLVYVIEKYDTYAKKEPFESYKRGKNGIAKRFIF